MQFDTVRSIVADTPFMEPDRARYLYDFIIKNRLTECLELGFAHGVSSCYIAAALDELGEGHLTSVDLAAGLDWQRPSIEEMLQKTGLERHVTVVREPTSYTWFLKKVIEQRSTGVNCEPLYNFCFIDGPKNWTIDGCAFFLVDKLLLEGGWILFDDVGWRYDDFVSGDVMDGFNIRTMPEDERATPQIELVFRLLVMQHPNYANFLLQDDWWGWAQKCRQSEKSLVRETTIAPVVATPSFTTRLKRKILG